VSANYVSLNNINNNNGVCIAVYSSREHPRVCPLSIICIQARNYNVCLQLNLTRLASSSAPFTSYFITESAASLNFNGLIEKFLYTLKGQNMYTKSRGKEK